MTNDQAMADSFVELLALDRAGDDTYIGPPAPELDGRMFGGQLLAQGLAACAMSTADDRIVHSIHGYFLSSGTVDDAVTISVERVRDGRSFSNRSVSIVQNERELFRGLVSLHVPEPGLRYSPVGMPEVAPPEEVSMTYADFCKLNNPDDHWFGVVRPIDIRYVNAPLDGEGVPVTESQKTWMRIPPRLPDSPLLHTAGLAYLSDATLIDHALLPHGFRWQDDRLTGASLDHTMYFHEPMPADQWMLYDQFIEFTGGARAVAHGTLYSATGDIVATCLQEGLIRWDA